MLGNCKNLVLDINTAYFSICSVIESHIMIAIGSTDHHRYYCYYAALTSTVDTAPQNFMRLCMMSYKRFYQNTIPSHYTMFLVQNSNISGSGWYAFLQGTLELEFVAVILQYESWNVKMNSKAHGSMSIFFNHTSSCYYAVSHFRSPWVHSHIHTLLGHVSCMSEKISPTVMAVSHFI